MTTRIGVVLIAVCLVLYFVVAGQQGILFIGSGAPVAIVMGAAIFILPLIGVWALVREVRFGVDADRLGRTLDAEGGMPEAETELTTSGRIAKDDQDAYLHRYTEAVAAAPEDWRAQYRLGVVQDAAGRRKDARASIRAAIALSKTS